jgi:hypothetical protein
MGTRTMSVSFNTDGAGFMSQECPSCEERFKTQPGKGSPNPVSHCPYCGHEGTNCWFTPEQAEYLRGFATQEVLGPHLEELDRNLRRIGSSSGGLIKVTGRIEKPRAPPRPEENDDDMPKVMTFACCGETIRHDAAKRPLYCVICGKAA